MVKRTLFSIAIILMILITACDLFPASSPQATPTGFNEDEIATIVALSTQVNKPTDEIPQLPSITSTPGVYGQSGDSAEKTPLPGSIKLTGIKEKSSGTALITWEASGDFPSGFKIVWTDEQGNPTYPEDTSIAAVSSTARSAAFSVTPNKIYYVRVCRFLYDKCDIYSDLGIFAFAPPTATPRPTKTSIPGGGGGSGGTVVPYDPTLVITLMKGGETGKAYMAWTDKSTSSKGYMIVYSKTSTVPTFGTDSKFYVSDPNARFAYVNGTSNTKYYYRICRYTGSTCGSYSAVFTYTFPPVHTPTPDGSVITITGISDTTTGSAEVSWTATGDFPNGFKILYSKTTALPTLSDSVVVVSNGATRVGTITGDPGALYHVRVCKYNGSTCAAYSAVVDFTFAADPATITISGLVDNATVGSIDLEWEATGTFPDGFKLLYSTSQATPTFDNASKATVGSGAARSGTIVGAPNTHYYLRICKYTGSTCGVYSDIVEFTTAADGILLSNSGDLDVYDWALTPNDDHTDGYHLFWIEDTITPVWEVGLDQQSAVAADRSITLSSSLTTGHYILRLCTWDAAESKCSAYSNTLEVDVP